jgi:hypothetical protein
MLGPILAALAFLMDATVVAVTHAWPTSSAAIFGLLAAGWVLSLAAYSTLRSSRGGSGPPEMPPDPDPPWWPDFERDFRDYTRGGPRPGARQRPRQPVA